MAAVATAAVVALWWVGAVVVGMAMAVAVAVARVRAVGRCYDCGAMAAVATAAVVALWWVGAVMVAMAVAVAVAVAVARVRAVARARARERVRAMVMARVVARAVAKGEAWAVARFVAVVLAVARCIVFSLTAKGISNDVVCHATSAMDVAIFRHATLALRGIVICRSITAMRGEHINQPNEGCAAKVPATEAKQQATTRRHNKRTRGRRNTNASATSVVAGVECKPERYGV
jgi:hypothetical protein